MAVHIVRLKEGEEDKHNRESIEKAERIFEEFRRARDEEEALRKSAQRSTSKKKRKKK